MASFGYTVNEIVRLDTDFALKWNYAWASTRIHQDIKGAAYKRLVRPVLELGSGASDPKM